MQMRFEHLNLRFLQSLLFQGLVHILLPVIRKIFRGTFIQEWRITQSVNSYILKVITKPDQSGYYLTRFRGSTMYFPPGDVTILPTVLNGSYEKLEFEWLYNRIQTVSSNHRVHLIDIGANIGIYTVPIAKYFDKSIKITAVEPDPYSLDLLKKNIKANNIFSIVKVLPFAVSVENLGENGTCKFSQNKYGATNKIISSQTSSLETSITVQVIQLSDLLVTEGDQEFKKIIKIDVEGSEVEVIKSGFKEILAMKPDLIIEVSNKKEQSNLQSLMEMLSVLIDQYENAIVIEGKKITRISGRSAASTLKDVRLGNVILWTDSESELR